jgi:hypothetical protein
VENLVGNEVLLRGMSQEAYLAVADKSWENNNEALLRHYEDVLGARASASLAA